VASSDLEAPPGEDPNWDVLYVARGDEVLAHRPLYTGDVFSGVAVRTTLGQEKNRPVMVIQHPCTMRNGVVLKESLLVARVHEFKVLPRDQWTTNERLMPLPDLRPEVTSNQRHQAAFFDEGYFVHPDALDLTKRIACLSEIGTYLLLQRWVFHSSRVAPPRWKIEEMNGHVYAEADLLEAWCEAATGRGVDLVQAMRDADAWLSEARDGTTRRAMLRTTSLRSRILREMRQATQELYGPPARIFPMPTAGMVGE
jgi:hypothetical protein